ncbi:conserved Plasmodium protein, unknown function [Plasmodium ovale wallikeri]|uniref:Mon2/Sec7/BIG1-like dimerisation and cyclophilin-binding domain-containing protein n=1 Tax=Plasmodium ovale wallikeri TaxID=864142 RepID=A0A1A8ZH24_PLAOA|nr:conserved Plasmodium protein, unknown function [Plasmodium ovale wallikeri]
MNPPSVLEELENDLKLLIAETKKKNICIKEKTEISIIKIKNYNSIIISSKNHLLNNFEFPLEEIIEIVDVGINIGSHRITCICLTTIQRLLFYILYLIDNKDVIKNFKEINIEKEIEKITNKLFDLTFIEDKKILIKILQIILTAFSPQYIQYYNKDIINTLLKILYSIYYSSLYDNNLILYQTCCAAYKQLLNSLIDVCNKEELVNQSEHINGGKQKWPVDQEKRKRKGNRSGRNGDERKGSKHCRSNDRLKESGVDNCKDGQKESSGDHSNDVNIYFDNFDLHYNTDDPIDLIYVNGTNRNNMQNKNKLLSLIHYLCYCCFVNIRSKYYMDSTTSYECGPANEEKEKKKNKDSNPNMENSKNRVKSKQNGRSDQLRSWDENCKDEYQTGVVKPEEKELADIREKKGINAKQPSSGKGVKAKNDNAPDGTKSIYNNRASNKDDSKNCGSDKHGSEGCTPSGGIELTSCTQEGDPSGVNPLNKSNFVHGEHFCKRRNSKKDAYGNIYSLKSSNIKNLLKILKSTNSKNGNENRNNTEFNEIIHMDSVTLKTDILSSYNKNNLILPLNFCLDLLNNKKSVSSVSSTELEDEPSKGTKKTRKTRKKTEKMAEKRKGLNILGGECSNSLNANGLEGTITCKEDILHSIKSYRNIKDGVVNAVIGHKIEGNKDDDTDRDRPVSNEKKIYTNKKQSSEKKIERKLNHSYVKNDMKEETNLNYKEEYYKDRDDFVFIKIVEYISKIIHELLFLHSIDITKMYIHLKVFKYDRICTTERIRDQLVDKARCKYSNNDTDEGEKYLVEKKQCVGENSPFRKTDRCDEKILEERKIKKEENEISFCNFLSYPLILPNNSINPREDFYLFKYSSEKRVNKILFDDLCYKDADEIRLLASSIDSILSLINSYYVIFLNILKKSFNQYCFATIDLNEEKNTPQIDSLRNSINNQENENYIQEGEIAKLPSKSACGHMSVRKFELENENDNECLDFDYEVNRRIERCCIENVADKHNKLKDRGGSRSGSGSSSDSSSNRSSGSRSNVGLVEGKGEKRCSSYRRKSNSYDEHISLFCYVFNSTCRYFISSLCLIFSYTNTLDACFFNGFQKLIFMSTHLKINICTNACLQTLTKCSSIFTLENSPFFLKILRNFEKQGNKNDSNTSLKKNKTGSKTSKVVMTYSSSERKNVFSQRSETNSINNNVTITVESKGNPVCTENTPEQVKKNSNEHVHTLNDTRKESQSGNDLNKDSNFMGNVTACTAEQESNVYSCKGRCTNNESNDSLLGRNKQTYANLKCETKKGKTSNFTGSTSLVTTFVLDSNGENENNILNSCTVADAYRGNDVSNVVELEKKGNDTNMDALDDLCDETSDSEEDDVHDYAENCKSKEPTSGECGGSIFRGGEVPSSVGATSDKNSYAGRESFSKRMSIESVEANFISCKPALNENLLTYFDDVISIILKESYYINNDLNNVKYILSIKTVISIFYIFGDNLHFENWLKLINLFVEINYIYKYISSIENKTIEFLNFLHHINKNEDEFTFSLNKCLIDPDKNTYLQNVNSKSIEFCYFILRFIQKNPVLCAEITVIFSSFSHFFKNTVFYNMSTLINILNSIHFMIFNQFFKQKKFMRKDYDKLVHMDCNPRGYPIYTSLHASAEKVNVGNTAFNGSSLNAIKFSSERAYDKDSTTMKRGKEGSEKWGKDKVYNDNSAEAIVAKVAGRGHGGNASGNEHCCSGKEKTKNADKISQSEDCMQRRSNHFSKSNKKKSIIEKYIHFVRKNGDIFVIFYYYLAHFDPVYTAYFTFYSDMFFLKNGIVKEEEKRMKCSKGVISPEGCSNLQHIDIEEDKGKLEKDVNYRKCNKELKKKSLKKIHIGENNNKIDEENITNINNLFNILEIIIVDYIEEIPVFVDYIINRADMLKENISNAKIEEKKRYFENKKKGNVKLLHVCVVENKKIYIYENDIKMKNIKMKSFFIFILNHLMKLCFDERIEVRNCSIKTIISILSTHICKFDFFFYKTSICLLLKRLTMKYYYKLQEYFKLENNNAQRVHSIELTCSLGNEMGQSNNSKEPEDRYSEEDNYKQQSNYAERSNSGGHAEQGNHKQPHGCSIKVNEHNPYATECKEIKESVYTSINGRNMVKTAEDVNFECFNGDNDFKCWLVKPQVRDREKCNRDYLREEFRNSFINLTKEQQEEATKKKKKCSKNEKQTEKKKMHKLQKAHKTKDGADLVREVEEIVALPNVSGDKVLEEDKNGDLYNYVNENFSKIIIHHSRDSKLKQWIESFILIIEGCNRILLEQKNYKKFYVFYDIFVNILRTILFIEYNKKNMFELHISILQILNNIFMSKLTYFDVFYFTTKNSVMRKNRCTDYINIFDKCFYYLYNYAYYVTDQKIKDFIIKLIAENLKNIHCHKWVYLHSLMYLHLFNLLFSSNSDIVVSGEEKGNFSFLNYDSVLNKLFFDYFVDNAQGNERRNAESEEEGIYENENEEIEDTQMDNEEKRIDKRDNTERADEHEASEEDRNNKRENTERVVEHKAIEEDRTNERENTERMDEKKTSEEDEVMCSADESMIERKSQVFNREGKLSFKDSHFTFEYKTNNSSIDPLNIYNILENSKEVYNVKNIVMYPNLKKKNIHKIYLSGDINSDIFIIVMQIFQTLECDKINLLINEELLKSMNILLHHLSENKEKRSIYTKLVNFIFNDKILFNENSEEIIDKIELNDTYNKLEMNVNNNELNEENKECSNDKIDMLDIMLIKFIRNSYLVESSRPPLFIKIYLTKIISELNDRKRRAFSSWTLQILFEEYEKMAAENYKDRYYTTFITLVMLKKCVLTLKSFSNENNENADEVLFILYEMKKLKCYYSHIDMQSSSILKCSEDKAHLFICYPYLLDCLNTKNKKVFTTVKELLKLIPIML